MNYNDFRLKAVVDFIEIEIRTKKTTNFMKVQKSFMVALGISGETKPFVKAINETAGRSATIFRVTLHDIARYQDLLKVFEEVRDNLGLESGFQLTKIEVALDAYNDNLSNRVEQLTRQAANFYKFLTHPVSDNHRIYRDFKGSGKQIPSTLKSLIGHTSEGYQIGIGDKDADYYQHIYYKTTDAGGKHLPTKEYRARIEIRLAGNALTPYHQDGMANFKFQSLSKFFSFRKYKNDLDPLQKASETTALQIGERRKRNRSEGGVRHYSRATQADVELNRLARAALRNLSERWMATAQTGRPTRAAATPKKPSACEKRGGIIGMNPHKHGEEVADSNNYLSTLSVETTEQVSQVGSDQQQPNNERDQHRSDKPATRVHADQATSAVDSMMRLHDATPTARAELERVAKLMEDNDG